jgi:hypothetical protein
MKRTKRPLMTPVPGGSLTLTSKTIFAVLRLVARPCTTASWALEVPCSIQLSYGRTATVYLAGLAKGCATAAQE